MKEEQNINGLPKDWGIVRLGDYAKTEKGKKPKFVSKEQTKEFSIPYVNIKAFEQNIIDEYTDGVGCVLCEDDDFLMVWDGSRSGYVGKAIKGALGSTLVKIKLPDVDHDFAYYFLQSKFIEINSRAKGVGIPHVDPNIVWNYKFPLPPPDTQQQIVSKIEELFSELDKGIEELKTAQQQLKVYRQAVLKWAFENETENREVKLLSEVSAKIQIGPFGTQLHKEDYIVGGIPLINPMHIQEGQIMADSSYSIKEEKRDSLPNYILQNGDVIMGRRGEMGRCGLVTDKEEGWFCGTGSLYVRPNKKLIDSKFLYHLLQSRSIKKYLDQNAGGTTMANLNLKIVNNIPLHLPTLEEQQQIVQEIESRLSVCDKIEETITNSLKQAEALRQSILKKAFEGKLL
jgi:type I restriction enzyme S subunit